MSLKHKIYGNLLRKKYGINFDYTQLVYEEFCKTYNALPAFRFAMFPVEIAVELEFDNGIHAEYTAYNIDTIGKIEAFHKSFNDEDFIFSDESKSPPDCFIGNLLFRCTVLSFEKRNKVVEVLTEAFRKDPNALHALIYNRVPCNEDLANDEFVQVDGTQTLPTPMYQVGALGLINAVLAALNQPLVAVQFTDERDVDGRYKIVGFCEYNMKE